MNKKQSIVLIGLSLVFAFVVSAFDSRHVTQSFIKGNGSGVYLTNGTTISSTTTNVFYTNALGVFTNGDPTNPVWVNCSGWANGNGDTASNAVITVTQVGFSANSTNTNTYTFARSVDGTNFDTANGSFSFTVIGNGTTSVTQSTNLPTWFLSGTRRIAVTSVAMGTVASSTNCFIQALELCGFVP